MKNVRRTRHHLFIGLVLIVSLGFTSCLTLTGLFPIVPNPVHDDSSMLIVEIGTGAPQASAWLTNANYSGWAPIIIGPDGREVPFINNEAVASIDTLYYSPNLEAGNYTLVGFMHVYTDFSLVNTGTTVTMYGPYEHYSYQVRQVFLLPDPVTINLEPGTMTSFGRYFVDFTHLNDTSDERWKIVESSFSYTNLLPDDKKALQVMKNWATPEWAAWNSRNREEPVN